MNLHEHQAKDLFAEYGIAVPEGHVASSCAEAEYAAQNLGGGRWVVKAQVHAGGRGKAGGVKVVKGVDAATEAANEIFGKTLVTHQTGPEGKVVQRLLVEQGLAIKTELYLALVVDRVLDMCRTSVNVFSDSCCAVTIARLEGEETKLVKTS